MPAEEDPNWRGSLKSRLVRVGLTIAGLAAALMAGAASLKVG